MISWKMNSSRSSFPELWSYISAPALYMYLLAVLGLNLGPHTCQARLYYCATPPAPFHLPLECQTIFKTFPLTSHTFSPMWYPLHPRCLPKGKLFKTVLCSFQHSASFSVLGCRKPGHQLAESQGYWLCESRGSQKSPVAHHGWSCSRIFLSSQRKKYYIYHL